MRVIEPTTLSAPVLAALLVGAVFAEAVALYVGYGALERVATRLIGVLTGV